MPDLLIVSADQQQAMTESSREDLVWDPTIMKFVSEDDGVFLVMQYLHCHYRSTGVFAARLYLLTCIRVDP